MVRRKSKTNATATATAVETDELELSERTNPNPDADSELRELDDQDIEDSRAHPNADNGNGAGNGVGQIVLELDPDNVLDDPDIMKLREWSGASDQELAIPELARTIAEEGQDQPALVRETPDGYMIVDGHRRKAAIKLLREEGDDIALRVIVQEKNDDQALRGALLTFTQHKGLTGIEFGKAVKMLRARFHLSGSDGTAEIANYMGVSPATITQYERLTAAAPETQAMVKNKRMKATTALEAATSPAEVQPAVVAKAAELADAEHAEKATKRTRGRKPKSESETPNPAPATDANPAPAPITTKHVRAAQKLVPGALPAPKAARMADAITFFTGLGSDSNYPDVMCAFAKTFVSWAHGKLKSGDAGLQAAWDDVADKIAAKPVVPKAEASKAIRKVLSKPVAKPVKKPVAKPVAKPASPKPSSKLQLSSKPKPKSKPNPKPKPKPKSKSK